MNSTNILRNDLNSLTLAFASMNKPMKANRKTIDTFLHILSEVKDFRQEGKTVYKLENLLFICFYLSLKGEFTSFRHVADYVQVKQNWFIRRKLIEKGKVPSHDTFMRVFQYLDANSLRDVFLERIKYLMKRLVELDQEAAGKKSLLSGDGKEIRGSGRKDQSHNINVFNIYNVSNGLCLSSTPLVDKDPEIREFQRLLPKFRLDNCIVTADALHCQRKTCSIILDHKGEYVITAKGNQQELRDDIAGKINEIRNPEVIKHHNCEYTIMILKDYIGADWPGAKAYVKMISHKRKGQKDYNAEPQYFLSSVTNKELIVESIDNRWSIEDELHLFKDDFLREDECTFTNKNAIKTMAAMNNIVFALYRLAASVNNETMQKPGFAAKMIPWN